MTSIDPVHSNDAVRQWQELGRHLDTPSGRVFVIDADATDSGDGDRDPLLVLHGFPSSSFDFRHVLAALRRRRRVVLFDQLGFGLSDKPDRRYGIHLQADTAEFVATELGVSRVDLLTHDMGDSVGGELLARNIDGTTPLDFGRRVISNGSIYLELAKLTAGQHLLLSLPDEPSDLIGREALVSGLAATFADQHPAGDEELEAQWALASRLDGHRLLPRTIRYLEDRRAEESRYTGAIERHRSPLGIVWGALDPIAVLAMADRLHAARPDATRTVLDGVAHYPMVESPAEFADAVLTTLDAP